MTNMTGTRERLLLLFGALVPLACGERRTATLAYVPVESPTEPSMSAGEPVDAGDTMEYYACPVTPDTHQREYAPNSQGGALPNFATKVCTSKTYNPLKGLRPSEPPPQFWRLQYWQTMGIRLLPDGSSTPNVRPLSHCEFEAGSGCTGVAEGDRCREGFVDLIRVPPSDQADSTSPYVLLAERGTQWTAARTWSEVGALLGPIDTLAEAALLLTMRDYVIDCEHSSGQPTANGWVLTAATFDVCGDHRADHVLDISKNGAVSVRRTIVRQKEMRCVPGRRPQGLGPVQATESPQPGAFFARAAELEQASVVSFRRIAHELRRLGAPRALVERAERAARDEVDHTQKMTTLALRFGATPISRDVEARAPRDLLEFALDNATEGCLRETFAALLAWQQASSATDGEVACAMQQIALDETEHAALSWDLLLWAQPLLHEHEREQLRQRVEREYAAMLSDIDEPLDDAVHEVAGMPRPTRERELLSGLYASLQAAFAGALAA